MKAIIEKLAQIAELQCLLYDMQNTNATDFFAKHPNDSHTYEDCKSEIGRIRQELKSAGYVADSGIMENLRDVLKESRYITTEDITKATKLNNTDAVYYIKAKTKTADGTKYTKTFRIHLDADYTNRTEIYNQDVINTVWGITTFFGQMLTDIIDCKKVES